MTLTDAKTKPKRKSRGLLHEFVSTVLYPLGTVVAIYVLLFQPFRIPSGSMIDTLLVGDYVWVTKFSYGYSRHSMFFSPPLFEGRIWAAEPKRGDVAVFKLPTDGQTDYIKRVIGLPGDKVQVRDGVIFVNGEEAKQEFLGTVQVREAFGSGAQTANKFRETLPGGVVHEILRAPGASFPGRGCTDASGAPIDPNNTSVYDVPQGFYLMMGDNRDNSIDSRCTSQVGLVPFEFFVGRADLIFPSSDGSARWWALWEWPAAMRWDRLFVPVR